MRAMKNIILGAAISVAAVASGAIGVSGCAAVSAATVVQDVLAGIDDAGLVLQQIQTFVSTYFASKTDATNQALAVKINAALTDARNGLDLVVRAGAVATDITDANLQQALTDFSTEFAAVVALGQQIGVQVSGTTPTATPKPAVAGAPGLVVSQPMILSKIRAKKP